MRNRRDVTVIEDEPVVHREAAAAESEAVTTYTDGWTMARGFMRMFNSTVALVMLIIEALLAFRLAFALGGANRSNGFVDFIYDWSHPFVAPFEGIAARSVSGKTVFEPETVIAMAVWLVVALIVVALVNIFMSAPAPAHREASVRERQAHYDRNL
jgi:hypothetical protein